MCLLSNLVTRFREEDTGVTAFREEDCGLLDIVWLDGS